MRKKDESGARTKMTKEEEDWFLGVMNQHIRGCWDDIDLIDPKGAFSSVVLKENVNDATVLVVWRGPGEMMVAGVSPRHAVEFGWRPWVMDIALEGANVDSMRRSLSDAMEKMANSVRGADDNPLLVHACRELERAGAFDTSMYDGMIGEEVMRMMRSFAGRGHSGMSAAIVRSMFTRVSAFKALTPITSDPSEWMHVADEEGSRPAVWQNTRQSSCFSNDGGMTYYDIDANDDRAVHESASPVVPQPATP